VTENGLTERTILAYLVAPGDCAVGCIDSCCNRSPSDEIAENVKARMPRPASRETTRRRERHPAWFVRDPTNTAMPNKQKQESTSAPMRRASLRINFGPAYDHGTELKEAQKRRPQANLRQARCQGKHRADNAVGTRAKSGISQPTGMWAAAFKSTGRQPLPRTMRQPRANQS
jgi:hypothetical protein